MNNLRWARTCYIPFVVIQLTCRNLNVFLSDILIDFVTKALKVDIQRETLKNQINPIQKCFPVEPLRSSLDGFDDSAEQMIHGKSVFTSLS